MNKQEIVRQDLNTYIEASGIKAKFICEKVLDNLDTSVLCRFRKGERDLFEDTLSKLEKYLDMKQERV